GFFFSVFLISLILNYDTVIIFWIGALSVISFLFLIWYFFLKVSPLLRKDLSNIKTVNEKKPSIVLIGGGTGLSTILRGIKNFASYDHSNISAIVTVADDGGSSGKLRKEMDIIAPGDLRNCIVALSKEENLLARLFNYRFETHGELSGHSFGNLFLAALAKLNNGDFDKAVKTACDILAVKGKIIPASLSNVNIGAKFDDETIIKGESKITEREKKSRIIEMFLEPENAKANDEAISAINNADAIILGPGSLYTSIIPNLLFPGIREAVVKSKALKIYVCNIMTQPGETDSFTVSDHVKVLNSYIPGAINYAIVNKAQMSYNLLERYKEEDSFPVQIDIDNLKRMNITPVLEDILLEGDYFRHNADKLARIIIKLVEEYGKIK
ncbi:MAG: YvcK family protein, partial [Candidatus Muiribacteriota bacterium]